MNAQIIRLFGMVVLLFGTLVGFTSWRSVVDADELRVHPANARPLLESLRIRKGTILTREGTAVARDVAQGAGARRVFRRTYPEGDLFGHPIGYSFLRQGASGIEQSYLGELTGQKNEFVGILDQLRGKRERGDALRTSLDARGQRTAVQALAGRPGSVVALEPRTGRVRVMASVPPYDPNQIPERLSSLNRDEENPLVNRATQAQYPPGSIFKVVTAAAALESGRYSPQSVVDGRSGIPISGVPLSNFGGQDFGSVDLTTALTRSVNTVWAQVAVDLGPRAMYRTMERFGLNRRPPIDLPSDQIATSGIFLEERGLADSPDDGADIGRVAIGQGGVLVTPLQMAMVAGAVANDGVLMKPRIGQQLIDPDGRRNEIDPESERRTMSVEDARTLRQMMVDVVESGTGTGARIPGVTVAGKTGTAEIDVQQGINQAWFLAFAPVDSPRIAVVATIERTTATGGEDALPVVRTVMQELLDR